MGSYSFFTIFISVLSIVAAIGLLISHSSHVKTPPGQDASCRGGVDIHALQWDARWGNLRFGGRTLASTGSGILSVVNAIYACSGNFPEPSVIAQWAYSEKFFNYYDAGCRPGMVEAAARAFGSRYGFRYAGSSANLFSSAVKDHCRTGGACVAQVNRHFITIADYDLTTGKYLVLDCAPNCGIRTGVTALHHCWKTPQELTNGHYSIHVTRCWLYAKDQGAGCSATT